jgi:ABC-type lipoprotein export system ATPase subunit
MDVNNIMLNRIYNAIENPRRKYGHLIKCEFHLHTPASHDYNMISGKKYNQISLIELLQICEEYEYLSKYQVKLIADAIDEYISDEYLKKLKEQNKPFESFKEYLAYMLIAHMLYINDIGIVVVADHNTTKGFNKLQYASEEYLKSNGSINPNKRLEVFLGVEISCSDENHLIVITDKSKHEQLNSILEKIIKSEKKGTALNSQTVIEHVESLDAITYIAHINSSNLVGNEPYNESLLNSKGLGGIGLTNIDSKKNQVDRLRNFRRYIEKEIPFIYEGDSHEVDTIGQKSTWIKFSSVNYSSLKRSFKNFPMCIYNAEKPSFTDKYIKGLVVYPGKYGFLNPKPNNGDSFERDKYFCIDFSRDLNCVIGGRGTGKSTLLNILQTIYSTQVYDLKTLEYVSRNDIIFSVFHLEGVDYVLKFIPQVKLKDNYSEELIFNENEFEHRDGKIYLSKKWFELYKFTGSDYERIDDKFVAVILNSIFRRGYSINKIISKIDDGKISDYIREIVTYGIDYKDIGIHKSSIETVSNNGFVKYLRENMQEVINLLETRKKNVDEAIKTFNLKNSNILRVAYSPNEKKVEQYIEDFIKIFSRNGNVAGTYLKWLDVQGFIFNVVKKIGFLEFLKLLLSKKYETIESVDQIDKYIDDTNLSFFQVEKDLRSINNHSKKLVYDAILNEVKNNRRGVESSIFKCFKVLDDFNIQFNVNSKEDVKKGPINLKNIEDLSLGQKVVAILSFLFDFGVAANDNTPLLIDQPEDNLDNMYIYRNLVKSLKGIKNTRQVIVVTHSSTIVTNADAEQVIVMESNSKIGWTQKTGYPSDKVITKHIINYLEGGPDSFKHKMETYTIVCPELVL